MKNILFSIGLIILLFSSLLNFFFFQKINSLEKQNMVIEVIDGDTIVLKTNQRIRLSNIEAPELEYCGGLQAKEFLQKLVLNKPIKIEFVAQDNFNRSLGLIYYNNQLINELILKEGWARYDGSPSSQREVMKKAYDEAFNGKKGIFSSLCRLEEPEDKYCLIKGNIDRSSGKKSYFFQGCSNFKQTVVEKDLGEGWFCSELEAEKAGFIKSPLCLGKKY